MHKEREKLNGDWAWTYGTPQIALLDDAVRQYADDFSEHTLAVRTCLERLQIARRKMLDEKYQTQEVL